MPFLRDPESCAVIVLTLGHFLWQGLLIAGVLAIALRVTKSASTRYWLSLGALLMMAACPVGTFGWLMSSVDSAASPGSGVQIFNLAGHELASTPLPDPPNLNFEHPTPAPRHVGHVSNVPISPPISPSDIVPTTIPPAPVDDRSWWQAFAPLLTAVYLCGVVVMLLRLLVGLWGGWRLRRGARSIEDVALFDALGRQARALGLKCVPMLAYCERVAVPTVIGILKPTILLPLAIASGLSPEQIEAVLAHELAHLRRYDHLVNLMQRVIESWLFFHPAVWWVSRKIRIEREHCCDDLVVACGAVPLDYATSLLVVAELSRAAEQQRRQRRSFAAVSLLATDGKPSTLRQRIARLLGDSIETPSLRISPRVLMVTISIPLIALIVAIQSGASNQQPSPSDDITQTSVARLTDDVTVELVGVTYHRSSSEPEAGWWTPSGRPLAEGRIKRNRLRGKSAPENHRIFVVEVRGVSQSSNVSVVISPVGKSTSFASWGGTYGGPTAAPTVFTTAGPFLDAHQTTVRVRVATDDWGPVQEVNTLATRINELQLKPEYEGCYEKVSPRQVREVASQTQFILGWPKNQDDLCSYEVWAIDKEGQRHEPQGTAGPPEGREFSFKLPRVQVARFEYRLRPYRHWATFEDVSLQPGRKTVVKVKTESQSEPKPEAQKASFTNALRLELKREAAHEGRWFFVDLDRGKLAKPPFVVELDRTKLPFFVLQPDEAALKKWLIESGTDLVLFVEPVPLAGKPGQWIERLMSWSIRTSRGHVNGLLAVPHVDGQTWRWNDRPELVVAPFARKNNAIHVSGFVPESSGGYEVRPDSPDLQAFRTANNVVGFTLLEHNDLTSDSLDLRIVHVANATALLADLDFDGLDVGGKLGAADPPQIVKPIKAEFPDGRSVEFVGITKNTRPTNEGWRPNGRVIGEVGYWKSTIYRSGNTTGSFPENGEHPKPNDGALDLLFRFRGLKAQPSLTFDVLTGGSYSRLPATDPYELRVTTERRGPPPPGGKYSTPDDVMRVGVTDEPWGKWLQVSATGEVLNPLTDDDSYRSSYELVRIQGVVDHDQSPDKKALLVHVPQHLSKLLALEMRGIDTDGKEQWLLEWQSNSLPKSDLNASRWGLASSEKQLLARYEFRLRPYRHWVTFENVSLEPGQQTDVKVKVESITQENINDKNEKEDQAAVDGKAAPEPLENLEGVIEAVAERAIALADGKVIETDADTKYWRLTDNDERPAERKELKSGDRVRYEFANGKAASKVVILPVKQDNKQDGKQEAAGTKLALRITGRVVDAETGKVIDKIRMVPTSVDGDDTKNITWQSQYLKDFTDGRFLYETDRPWDKTRLRIEAAGYRPAITRVVNKGEVVELEIKLERQILAGVVRLPNGQPAAKAQVALASWTNEVNLHEGKLSYGHHGEKLGKVVETDEQGRFVMSAEIDPSVLVVAHAEGYAERANAETTLARTKPVGSAEADDKPAEDGAVIELQPWGRVEGRVLMGDKPVVGAKYHVYQSRADDVHVQAGTSIETDAEGRFVVEQLPPGKYGTCQRYSSSKDGKTNMAIDGLIVRFDIPSGGTTTLALGSPGRTLIGKLALPAGFPHKVDWANAKLIVSLQAQHSHRWGDTSDVFEWSKFTQTDEGKLYGRANVAIAADGSFRIEGLPPAEYELNAIAETVVGDAKPAEEFVSGKKRFSVPGDASPDKVQTIDLGTIDLKPLVTRAGRESPDPALDPTAGLPKSDDTGDSRILITYDIPGAETETKVFVERAARGTEAVSTDSPLKNGKTLERKGLAAGDYNVARSRTFEIARGESGTVRSGAFLDYQRIKLEPGETKSIEFKRSGAKPATGQVRGWKELGVEVLVAFVCSTTPRDPRDFNVREVTIFDARNCAADGSFKTEPLAPGDYIVVVQGFEPLPRQTQDRTGDILPRSVGTAKLTIPATGDPKLVEVTLYEAKQPGKTTAGKIKAESLPVVGDFSKVDDPDVLLDQLAKSRLPSLVPQTGGGFFHQPGTPPQAMYVPIWENQYARDDKLDPRIRRLIELGDRAVPRVHQRLNGLTASDVLATHLTLVLRSVGGTESVPVLISLQKTAPTAAMDGTQQLADAQKSYQASVTEIAVTSALWKLTGRKHLFTPDQWEKWWQSVKPDFVVPRDRQRPEFASRVTLERVTALANDLATNEVAARERLISLGPAALPHLLKLLSVAESLPDPESATRRLAWVIDELGATDKLPAKLRRDYFTQRFEEEGAHVAVFPVHQQAACRALSHCSFADFCHICLKADGSQPDQYGLRLRGWMHLNMRIFSRRFNNKPVFVAGDPSLSAFWNDITPATDPAAEIAGAVPVIVAALSDKEPRVRHCAAKLADIVGFCSHEKPQPLIVALRDHWLSESDANIRLDIGIAMTRFSTPLVAEAISKGLRSDRVEIVSDAVGLMRDVSLVLNDTTKPDFDLLVKFTRHENDKLRNRAVRSLRGKAPSLLAPEFDRLITDKVEDIRQECAYALRDRPDPKFADILFKLADDPSEQVRIEALSSIAHLDHSPSMKRLLPYLRDKKVHGYAVSALASMGGQDALPLMMSELEAGNDIGGMVYQHLRRLTGERFEEKPEPWLAWWKKNKPAPAPDKGSAANEPADGLELPQPIEKRKAAPQRAIQKPSTQATVTPPTDVPPTTPAADPFDGPTTVTESGYPVIKQIAGELPDGWIACEFGLQYRVRAETTSLVAGELPLLFVDVRNRGTFKDMGLELHQSRHSVVAGGNRYERRDQPWAGVAPLEPEGKPLTLAFALSDDWKREGETKAPLKLTQGKHRIALSLMIAPVYPSPHEPQTTPASRKPIFRSLVCRPIEIEIRSGAWSGPPGSLGLENIRREVIAIPDFHSPKVPPNLQRLVHEHQPAAGDFLVKLIKSDDPNVQQAASVVFADAWDSMNREQVESYLLATMTHFVWQRPQYPQGVDAMIGMGPRHQPAYLGLPPDQKYSAETITTLKLDGVQVDQPIKYPGPGSLSHWVKTKDLSLGRHTLQLATKFTFTRGAETYRGEYESPEFAFEMVPAETPDDLIAPPDEQLDRLVREALLFAETEYELAHPPGSENFDRLQPEPPESEKWSPQIRWGDNKLGLSSLHCPVWKVVKRLPVDLCFSVGFRVANTDTVIPCNDLVALTADGERRNYFSTFGLAAASEFAKHADKDGFVSGRLVLKPSRPAALTDAKVKRYYGGEITSQPVRFKIAIAQRPNDPGKNPPQEKEKFSFPYFLPGSRIVVGEDLVNEANALASKDDQIQFLLKALPPIDQKDKRLSDRQVYAIRLLSLTDSDVVIDPLLDRLDFQHKGDGWPASHALGRIGERSVEPVVKKMESVANDLQKAIMLGNALIEIKQKKYPLFLEELRQRKDNKLSDKLLNQLLEVYQLAPND